LTLSFRSFIRNELIRKETITIGYLFETLSKKSIIKLEKKELHHRIRSTIHNLKIENEVVRVGFGKYKKN